MLNGKIEQYLSSSLTSKPSKMGDAERQERRDDFSPEWCQRLLTDRSYEQINQSLRKSGGSTGPSHCTLMGKTLFTDKTIRAMKFLYKPPVDNTDHTKAPVGEDYEIGGEVLALISLGDEMCSHANVLHGGINTTIIDEVGALALPEIVSNFMAVNFNVNLRKAVKTPGIILVRAWMDRPPEGRKTWVRCRD